MKGDCRIKVRSTGDEIVLQEGYSCLIPAAIADYDITPENGSSKVLDAYINNQNTGMKGLITKFLHFTNK